jgi:hypothetical protein
LYASYIAIGIFVVMFIASFYLFVMEIYKQKKLSEKRAKSIGKAFESIGLIAFSIFREVSERKSDKRTK